MLGVFRVSDKLGRRLVVILKGFPCVWGRCSFCPFYLEQTRDIRDLINTNRVIIDRALEITSAEDYKRIAVFNGGSFYELPYDTIEKLQDLAKGRIFEIESRSEYITLRGVKGLLKYYEPEKLVIRIGFEVWDEEIREKLLRKGMPNSELYRIAELRNTIKKLGLPVEFWVYVLFGIEYISEEKVVESVNKFRELFDGIIAIKYKKYIPYHPKEIPVSKSLARFLEENTDLVDWGENEQWVTSWEKQKADNRKD